MFGSAKTDWPAANTRPATATIRAHRMVIECLNQALILSHMMNFLCHKIVHADAGATRERSGRLRLRGPLLLLALSPVPIQPSRNGKSERERDNGKTLNRSRPRLMRLLCCDNTRSDRGAGGALLSNRVDRHHTPA